MQGWYWIATGIWGVAHRPSFEAVAGPKHDYWLVQAVGALVTIAGLVLVLAARHRRITAEIALLAIAGAGALAAIDIYYAAAGRIWPTYLLDAAAELVLVVCWVVALRRRRTGPHSTP